MTLERLVKDMKQVTSAPSFKREDMYSDDVKQALDARVTFPDHFKNTIKKIRTHVSLTDAAYEHGKPRKYHVHITGDSSLSDEEMQPVFINAFHRARCLQLNQGEYNFECELIWTPEDFQSVPTLAGHGITEVRLEAKTETVSPKHIRIYNRFVHSVRATLTDKGGLDVKTEGLYKEEHGICPPHITGGIDTADFSKKYHRWWSKLWTHGELWNEEMLKDINALAHCIKTVDLHVPFNTLLISHDEARTLLEKEIAYLDRNFDKTYEAYYGGDTRLYYKGFVERIARDQFGAQFVEQFVETPYADALDFLKKHGYEQKSDFKEQANDFFKTQRHLLAFVKQEYAKNPDPAIAQFRLFYQNKPLQINITARIGNSFCTMPGAIDASLIRHLKLPPNSQLYDFSLTEQLPYDSRYANDLALHCYSRHSNNLLPHDTYRLPEVNLWCRTSVDQHPLLALQEHTCADLGIKIS